MFQDQALALRAAGFEISVLSEDMKIAGPLSKIDGDPDVRVVYRGWMMDAEGYQAYLNKLNARPVLPFTTLEQYLSGHYLPNWYPLIEGLTPTTSIFPSNSPLLQHTMKEVGAILQSHVKMMRGLHHLSGHGDGSEWKKFQLKDYVKSLKTAGGSVLTNVEDIIPTMEKMEQYRGSIEGGICVRAYENLSNEKRYFVLNGKPYAPDDFVDFQVADLLRCAAIIPSPFFSVDIAQRNDGEYRIVEIGDGQVSDLVGWTPERFAEIWNA